MPNAYSQIYIHIIFAVKGRKCHISELHRDELEKYISGIINKFKCKCLSIYCNPDHIHMLISFSPCVSISDMVRIIKSNSSKFINEKDGCRSDFSGRKVMERFRMQNHRLKPLRITSLLNRSIIKRNPSKKNIFQY